MASPALDPTFLKELRAAQDLMKERMEKYTQAWNTADLETVLSYFVDEGLEYSDYGLMELNMNKMQLIEYFKSMGSLFGDMKIMTTGIHGAIDYCVWECIFEFTVLQEHEKMPFKKGQKGKIYNASMIWWNSDMKIYKEKDYAVWSS